MGTSAVDLEAEILVLGAQVNAATAALADALARFDAADGWHGAGIRSLAHWCDINLGVHSRAAAQLALVGRRLPELPMLQEAFSTGAVSADKAALVAEVAAPETDDMFTALAKAASAAQLRRICAAYRKVNEDEAPDAHEVRRGRRHVTSHPTDDGLVRIVALLEPDEAALVLGALDARVEAAWRRDRRSDGDAPAPDLAARRADALVELGSEGLVEGPDPVVRGERVEVHVHVDADVLTGRSESGRCSIEGVGAVSRSCVERLLCDCTVRFVSTDGLLDLGRRQRTPNRRQRRALMRRDGGCRFPGCPMRRFVDAHHVVPWDDLGPTNMDNLMLLCRAHHTLFHEGEYRIDRHGNGEFTFRRPDGRVIEPPPLRAPPPTGSPPTANPAAEGGGEPFDLALTIDALAS